MDTARLFQSGRSQAVRLPEEYRFEGMAVAVLDTFGPGFRIKRDPSSPLSAK